MKRLVLFTKQYPFGKAETYVHNEIPYLAEAFDEVLLVPYDAYHTAKETSRLLGEWSNVRTVAVNDQIQPVGRGVKLRREVRGLAWWLGELLRSRDKMRHLKRWRMCLARLRQCEAQAAVLEGLAHQENWKASDTLLYNYWFHYGVLLGRHLRRTAPFGIVSRAHSIDMYHKDWVFAHLFLPFEHLKLRTVDTLFAASQHGCDYLKQTFPTRTQTFAFRPLGVWVKGEGKRQLNETFTFVSATAVGAIKRLDRIPEILSKLEQPVRWVHFGSGKKDAMEALERAIDRYNLRGSVELRGHTPNEEVLRFYREETPDLYLNVSEAETIPVAVMEPMSFGIPVVGTAVYGTPEIIDGSNGLLIPVDFDADRVAEAITALRRDPDQLRDLGQSARQTFLNRFDADKNFRLFSRELVERLQP